MIVAIGNPITYEVSAATGKIPIVWIGPDPIRAGFAKSFARPGGNITGVSMFDAEFDAKRLQILKEAAPSASKVAYLTMRRTWEASRQAYLPAYQQASQRLQISLTPMLLQEATPSEIQHAFAEIAPSHSMTSSARASSAGEIVRSSALAAFKLMMNSNLLAW